MQAATFGPSLADLLDRETGQAQRRFATPGNLARYCEPNTIQTPALNLIDEAAVGVILGDVRRQQIYAPPQTGKSQRISRWTPLWAMIEEPTSRIAIVSAEAELARRWGRVIRRDLLAHPELGLTLRADSQAAGRWETTQGGELFCAGYAGGTTGRPIDLLIIDDPFKNRADAESETIRGRVWEFWENDASTRARRVILMHTRWHTDDLAGRLLDREPGDWSVLSMPAIAKDDDPLGREPGQEIQSANRKLHPPGYYHEQQKKVSSYVWASLYQQEPTTAEGGLFKRGDWRYWTTDGQQTLYLRDDEWGRDGRFRLADCARFITIDLAASRKTSADWTVAAAWAITRDGDLVLLDRVRARVTEVIMPRSSRRCGRVGSARTTSPTSNPRCVRSTLAYQLGRQGVPWAPLRADKGKLERALPYVKLVRQHRVWLPEDTEWTGEWVDEHAEFPNEQARRSGRRRRLCGACADRALDPDGNGRPSRRVARPVTHGRAGHPQHPLLARTGDDHYRSHPP
jgi:hypothetical protein